jgi:pyrroline-5-carboxylate reductase
MAAAVFSQLTSQNVSPGQSIAGFLKAGVSTPGRLCASVRTLERRELLMSLGVGSIYDDAVEGGAADVARSADVILLGVKPQALMPVLEALAPHVVSDRHLIISIAAGVRLASLENALGKGVRVVRAMPNTPCLIQSGASAYALGSNATAEDGDLVHTLLSSVGLAVEVEEKMMDAVTGLSGSGPAYVYMMVEALADGGVAAGLPRDTALALAAKTVAGAAQMIFHEDESSISGLLHPGVLKDRVASPAGTTIAGIEVLETAGVRGALLRAVKTASERSRSLGG